MKLLTKEENLECFKKKIRELGGDWAREDRVYFTNYLYGGEECYQSKAVITNLYSHDTNWNKAENSYTIYVKINNVTQRIAIRFRKNGWGVVECFKNFKDLKEYLEENNYLQMKITNKYRQGYYY